MNFIFTKYSLNVWRCFSSLFFSPESGPNYLPIVAYIDQTNKCLKRQYTSDYEIPLEVTKKPKDLNKNENYLEILVKYKGNYDLYVTEESGSVRYMELQLQHKPNYTLSDYLDKIR